MKYLLSTLILMWMIAVAFGQAKTGSTTVINANNGQGTNATLRGTNTFRGNANELHPVVFVNDQLGGSTLLNFSFGDGSSITSNRWRIGANSINFSIYDVKTERFPLSIASADGSAGGDGNVNINGVSITTNGSAYISGGMTVSNTLNVTSTIATMTTTYRILPTNGTIVNRYHLGDDLGQTFAWQWVINTNRVALQRQNSDTDFPFMATRTGVKVGSAGTVTTNTGHLIVAGGGGTSNAIVGGRLFFDDAAHTNHSTSGNFTNLSTFTVPAHTLTNRGDSFEYNDTGKWLSGTNGLIIGYGSITNVMSVTGITNGHPLATWGIRMRVSRTGNTSQKVYVEWWTDPGFGIQYSYTNWSTDLTETNGLANLIRLQGRALRAGGITSDWATVDYVPAPR